MASKTRFLVAFTAVVSLAAASSGNAQEAATSPDALDGMRRIVTSLDKPPVAPELWATQGIRLSLVAQHPQVATPTGIDVDEDGSLYVVSSHTHFRPDGYQGPQHDEVVVIRGKQRTVFYQQTDATMDLELGKDGWVYLAERDRILRVRDTDGDGKGDQEEDLAILETDEDYPHNGLAGMAWHPDGSLIFALGENYWKEWKLTAVDGTAVRGTGEGGIFRCTPDGKQLTRIARGFWNPFGVCVRRDGTMFAAENDPGARPPCRLLHVVEGGDYGYQRIYGRAPYHPFVAWNGELRGTLPMVTATGEAPCGVVAVANGVLVPSWADHRIDFFPLTPRGASFTSNRVEWVRGGDNFRPTCIVQEHDGRTTGVATYYLSDWVFGSYELHGYGRVWKLEVDLGQAPGVDRKVDTKPTQAAVLARKLYDGKSGLAVEEQFRIASGDDPYLARSALWSLSRALVTVPFAELRRRPARDRATAALALRLAKPKDVKLADAFLSDEDPDVRFEALRWIADEHLVALTEDVERLLRRSDIDYRTFSAAIATANTLHGNPRAGIEDPQVLLRRLRDKQSPLRLCAYALRLLPPDHKALTMPLLQELLAHDDLLMTQEVVRVLAAGSLPRAPGRLLAIARNTEQAARVRLEAVAGLAGDPAQVRALVELAQTEPDLRGEALRALRFAVLTPVQKAKLSQSPTEGTHELLDSVLDPQKLAAKTRLGRSEAEWLHDLDRIAEPIDLQAGRRLFHHKTVGTCSKCHRHTGRGNVVGPDLSAIHQRDKTMVLRAILQPSRDVSPQYYPWALETDDGQRFTGISLRKGGRSGREYYRDDSGKEQSFLKSEIVRRRELRTSLMPDGLVKLLTDRELRDLIAFLVSVDPPQ